MRSFFDKFLENTGRYEFLLILIPFVFWFYCFFNFFSGKLWLQDDAVSYAQHITYYTDALRKGVFPLWDPSWFGGAPYHFFLRRIGDVNPLLFIIVILKMLGVSSASAYLVFLGVYYFLAVWAFYLITRILLVDHFYAYIAYILLLFSSWGSEIFYNYIIIFFVPIIWFFYFLLCFFKKPQKAYFLGMFFCLGLIFTTYIPFFFLTIFVLFALLFVVFYGRILYDFIKRFFCFVLKNKIFTAFCIVFLISSCMPALIFYKESKSGDFVLPGRHSGSETSSEVAVGLSNIASGDIISHGYFDRLFDDHANIDMGDIYIPYIFFLILLITIFCKANKLIYFLLFNFLGLSLITVTSASNVHRFLFDHIIFFKFIRNIYYFFWLAILPLGILLAVTAFKSFVNSINSSSKRMLWLIYVVICHLVFIFFLHFHQGVLSGAWAAVLISMVYFWVLLCFDKKYSYLAGFCLLLLSVFIQSVQVYEGLDNKLFKVQWNVDHVVRKVTNPKKMKLELYYASNWFAVLVNYIDPQVLEDYRTHPFIIYDNVIPYKDGAEFFGTLQTTMSANTNIAFLSGYESKPSDWKNNPFAAQQADFDPIVSGKLVLLDSDANTWKLKTHLSSSQFLVINDNYNKDWHAFINGQPARLLRANVSFKGLWVPAGDSNILLRFATPKRYFFHISLIFLFVFTFLYLMVLLKRRNTMESYV